jgi:hypothetical protein
MEDDLTATTPADAALFGDVPGLIDSACQRAAVAVNSELVMLYWSVGKRVREEVLGGERAEYGQQVVKRLAERLTERYGRGWSRRNLEKMVRLAEWLPEREKCETLSPKLSWSHLFELLTIPERQKREILAALAGRATT